MEPALDDLRVTKPSHHRLPPLSEHGVTAMSTQLTYTHTSQTCHRFCSRCALKWVKSGMSAVINNETSWQDSNLFLGKDWQIASVCVWVSSFQMNRMNRFLSHLPNHFMYRETVINSLWKLTIVSTRSSAEEYLRHYFWNMLSFHQVEDALLYRITTSDNVNMWMNLHEIACKKNGFKWGDSVNVTHLDLVMPRGRCPAKW